MHDRNIDFDLDRLLSYLVHRFLSNNDVTSHFNNTEEDLLSEARIAAWLAITKYDQSKKTKLSTYVYACVENRLKDLRRVGSRKPKLDLVEDHEETFVAASSSNQSSFEHDLTMKQILTPKEYMVYRMIFVEDRSLHEIYSGPCRIMGMNQREAKKCLLRILDKYQLTERNRIAIST